MSRLTQANKMIKGCGEICEHGPDWICGSYNLCPQVTPTKNDKIDYCKVCKTKIEVKKDCWKQELAFLEFIRKFIIVHGLNSDATECIELNKKIKEITQALSSFDTEANK